MKPVRKAPCAGHPTLVRRLVTQAIRCSKKSREQIADQNRFPLQYLVAFCKVVDWRLLTAIAQASGFSLLKPSDRKLLELGRQIVTAKRATAAITQLEAELAEVAL